MDFDRVAVAEAIQAQTGMNVAMFNEHFRKIGEPEIDYSEPNLRAGIILGLAAHDQFGVTDREAVDIGAAFFWQAMLTENPGLEGLRERFVRKTFLQHERVMTELASQLK